MRGDRDGHINKALMVAREPSALRVEIGEKKQDGGDSPTVSISSFESFDT